MKIEVNIHRTQAGFPVERTVVVDGDVARLNNQLSRALTSTTGESGRNGVFGTRETLYRGRAFIEIDWEQDLTIEQFLDADAFLAELQRRLRMVDSAFASKYPVVHSTASVEILPLVVSQDSSADDYDSEEED